ncbi:CHASE3 domain-containing protein [Cribrihabitans neustonicus]|uniref:CHASE3 domain-containing protein n=1 Tax=Cribrihabitans neustonicus TaxID=1429085 RepID=UPI003B5CC374
MAVSKLKPRRRWSLGNLRTKSKIVLTALLPLILVMGVGVLAVVDLGRMAETAGRVEQTQKSLDAAQEYAIAAADMETGLRGYLLAGREEYLAPYEAGQARAATALAALRSMAEGRPDQLARLDEAAEALKGWQEDVAVEAISLRQEIGDALNMNDMADEVKKSQGKVYFEELRAEIESFTSEEEVSLEDKRRSFSSLVKLGIASSDYLTESLQAVEAGYGVINTAKDLLAASVDMETRMRGFLLAGDPEFLRAYVDSSIKFDGLLAKLKSALGDNLLQVNRLNNMTSIVGKWRNEVAAPAMQMRRRIGDAATMDDMADFVAEGRGKQYFDAFRAALGKFRSAEADLMADRRAEAQKISSETRMMIPAATGTAILIGAVMALVLGSSIASGVRSIAGAMRALAEGDNSVEIKGQNRRDEVGEMASALHTFRSELIKMQEAEKKKAEGKDAEQTAVVRELSERLSLLAQGDLTVEIAEAFPEDYEKLRQDFNTTARNLHSIVDQVAALSASIRNGAAEISQSSDDLSRRTESQAATLEETAAALDELTASVKSAAEGARSVETTMGEAKAEAEASGEVVQSAVSAMTEIEQSSKHISQIISVIDDIAFQTNLLALNAGVEAARAGEAGKGFAVVASEVRALAQRSSGAAMEIKTLIGDSSKQVERGVDLVGKTGKALQSIVAQVSHISQLVSGIAEGAAEQSIGLNEINMGMSQLDQVTQQNAAMVEEATAAGHMLNSDATKLAELMGHFNTGGTVQTAQREQAAAA